MVRVIDRRAWTGLNDIYDVGAVASLDDKVFVVCLNNYQRIEVYNAVSLQFLESLPIPGLGYTSWGLAACKRYNCVYASDWGNDCVHRVRLSISGNAVMRWSVASRPAGLSLTSDHNLLVASQGEYKLQEFTTHGILLRNIPIMEKILGSQVMQAVQLPDDLFLFTHFGTGRPAAHTVSAFSASNSGITSFSASYFGVQPLNRPAGLAVDKVGRVLVADWYNDRLLVMSLKKIRGMLSYFVGVCS